MKNKKNKKVDIALSKVKQRKEEIEKLRSIALQFDLNEELKWGQPCYTLKGKNVVLIQGFKEYSAFLFLKGFLMNDPDGVLQKMGEKTEVGRQIRFTNIGDIEAMEAILKDYIHEAIKVEKKGLKPEPKKREALVIPDDIQSKIDERPLLSEAFSKLTPGRQKAYVQYFMQAKQEKTQDSRIEKSIQKIMDGKGLTDY